MVEPVREDLCWVHSKPNCPECPEPKAAVEPRRKPMQPIQMVAVPYPLSNVGTGQPRRRAKVWRDAKGNIKWEMTYEHEEPLGDWIQHVMEQKEALESALVEDGE